MLWTWAALIGGLVCAGGGGELFVRGTVGLAQVMRLSPGIIAATVAAFATSSPELTVAISSALEGRPEISLGDALGSNVVNVALILAVALLMAPIVTPRETLKRDMPVALACPVAIGLMLLDGRISRLEGFILMAFFAAWLAAVLFEVRRQRSAVAEVLGEQNPRKALVESAIGLALLVAAGKLIVTGATGLAQSFGLSEFVIGATVVAVGTSIPELATAVISRIKGHDEVGLGTVLGSNIFNALFIVAVAAILAPISVSLTSAAPALAIGLASVMLAWPGRDGLVDRWRGGVLLALYVVYVVVTLQSAAG